LSIILYLDATNVDTLGKSQLHPIYVSIGNIKNWRRNKSDAKQLLGYLPILQASSNSEKNSTDFKKTVRETFHKSLRVLLEPLLSNNSINLTLNNEKIRFYPRISVVISVPQNIRFDPDSIRIRRIGSDRIGYFRSVGSDSDFIFRSEFGFGS